MRVFIPQLPTKRDPLTGALVPLIDTSIAMELGDVIICNDDMTDSFETRLITLERELDSFRPDDVLMIVGDYALCAAGVAVLMRMSTSYIEDGESIKIAVWNRETKSYEIKEI